MLPSSPLSPPLLHLCAILGCDHVNPFLGPHSSLLPVSPSSLSLPLGRSSLKLPIQVTGRVQALLCLPGSSLVPACEHATWFPDSVSPQGSVKLFFPYFTVMLTWNRERCPMGVSLVALFPSHYLRVSSCHKKDKTQA